MLRAIGRFVVNLHVKDFRVTRLSHKKGFVVEGCPAGRGRLDVPALLANLQAHGRDPNAVLELWPPPEPTPDVTITKEAAWVVESVQYLRQFIPD